MCCGVEQFYKLVLNVKSKDNYNVIIPYTVLLTYFNQLSSTANFV